MPAPATPAPAATSGLGLAGVHLRQQRWRVVDSNSEASKAGVQANDVLVAVQDCDKLLPEAAPGGVIPVTAENYHAALDVVRRMRYCKLMFQTGGFS